MKNGLTKHTEITGSISTIQLQNKSQSEQLMTLGLVNDFQLTAKGHLQEIFYTRE